MHADRDLRIDLGDGVHHVLEHDVVGVGARAARGLDDDGGVDLGGGGHDRQRLLHVVDVEGGYAVIVLGRVIEQLPQRYASHSIFSLYCAFAIIELNQRFFKTSTPGSGLPSIHSRNAPPAVET